MARFLHEPGRRVVVRHDGGLPGVYRDAEFTINSLGLRGREPGDDATRTLVLGGSTVEDLALGDAESWAGRLEGRFGPGAWVGNAGRSGMCLSHHLVQLPELLTALPRLDRVVVMAGLNDMLLNHGLHGHRGDGGDTSTAFGFVDGASLPGDASATVDLGRVISMMRARRRVVLADDLVTFAPPDVEALARFAGRAAELAGAIRAAGAEPVFVTQPTLWPNEGPTATHLYAGGVGPVEGWYADPRTRWFAPTLLAALLDGYADVLCASGVRVVDAVRAMPPDPGFFYDDFHLTADGASALAMIVAEALA